MKRLAGSLILIGIDTICLRCIGTHGPKTLELHNVFYIPEANVSLISQGQIHRQSYRLDIILDDIALGDSGIVVKLVSNNLYLVYLDKFSHPAPSTDSALTAINKKVVKMWHARLSHLGEQNI